VKKEIMVSGFGGQGVMSIGKSIVEAAMAEGMEVTWVPSYGPEMRGGTANCSVILSDSPIASPVSYTPSVLIAMNGPSLAKFAPDVVSGGMIFINKDIVDPEIHRSDVLLCAVSCDKTARELGNNRVANMVMLGAFAAASGAIKLETLQRLVRNMFTGPKARLADLNIKALELGAASVNGR
jgi:2-oxoglutarate ferredoxin oxidoreductase subunit gamma